MQGLETTHLQVTYLERHNLVHIYKHTVLSHCSHTLFSHTVLSHCSLTLFSRTVLILFSHCSFSQLKDFLSDRELRRVAYKLTGEEWSQLGTFLGFGDKELLQLTQLSVGGQEKAFRLLCKWRTRCRLSRSQMVSQLAVSLEEIKRKDVAQFVLEQFMSGKGRKKFFSW